METIKEADDEEIDSVEGQTDTLINVKTNPDFQVKHLDDLALNKKAAAFPRNFSTMSFISRGRKASVISNYSSMDFTGSSLQLHLQVDIPFPHRIEVNT